MQFDLVGKICEKYKCPNDGKCKDDLRNYIPEEYRCTDPVDKKTKQFKCNSTSVCVESMDKCYPEGAGRYNVLI